MSLDARRTVKQRKKSGTGRSRVQDQIPEPRSAEDLARAMFVAADRPKQVADRRASDRVQRRRPDDGGRTDRG